jgi:hypothetical protein
MGLFNTEVELIIPPTKKSGKNDKPVKAKSLNGYDAIREKIDEDSTLTVKKPVITEKPKTKVSIGL